MSRKTKTPANPNYNEVHLVHPKPNQMFPEWMTQRLRFMKYMIAVPCAHCGKRSKSHWTMTMNFRVAEERGFEIVPGNTVYQSLTSVCSKHMLHPELPTIAPEKAATESA